MTIKLVCTKKEIQHRHSNLTLNPTNLSDWLGLRPQLHIRESDLQAVPMDLLQRPKLASLKLMKFRRDLKLNCIISAQL
jgi:hypothetical protein